MGNSSNRHVQRASRRSALNRNPLALACAAAFLLAANASYAQDSTAATTTADAPQTDAEKAAALAKRRGETVKELETVKVTGIRRGIENAIEKKKDANSIVEVISAEDLGKLPDTSIAEALARTPGLAAQRVGGRASVISIRGLSPDFSTALLNGRDQVSVGDNRGVEFDQYPSELINGVTVYKTPDARLVGQGLSGTVDLQTLKPLSFAGRQVALNARYEKNSMGEVNPGYSDTGNRISATYINQFADHTVGVALGIARLDSPGQNERWRSWGYPTGTVNSTPNVAFLGGSQFYASSTDQVRTGIVGVLEFRPSDTYSSTLDVFYSKFDKTETTRGLEVCFYAPWGCDTSVLSNAVVEDNVLKSGTLTGVHPVVRSDQNRSNDDVFAIGWNQEFKLSDDWTGVLDLSMSKAKRDDRLLELYAGNVNASNTPLLDVVSFELSDGNSPPTFDFGSQYADPAVIRLTDSSGWGQAGFVKSPKVRDELRSIRGSLKRDFTQGAISSVEFGINYADREKKHNSAEFFIDLKGPCIVQPNPNQCFRSAAIPTDLLQTPPPGVLIGGPTVVAYDVDGVFNSGLYSLRADTSNGVINRQWSVNEKVLTGYGQMNIDTDWGSVPVRGNVGVQVVHTDQSSDGFSTGPGGSLPYSAGTTYNDVLPSANLAFTLPHDQILRLAAARQIARAPLDNMRANNSISCNTGGSVPVGQCRWSGNGGNPGLKPTLANALDIGYEKYFGVKAYFGLAWFYKDLKTYIYNQDIPFDYSSFTPPSGFTPVATTDNFNAPANGTGGTISGAEATLSLPFNLFAESLDGFGMILNYNNTSSKIKPQGPNGPDEPIPGLSRTTSNATLYYEKYGFSARISQRHRGDFIGSVRTFNGDRSNNYIKAESIIDFQTGYDFKSGTMDGLSLLFQVNNLTNERYAEYNTNPNQPLIYAEYGRTMLFGVNYKF